MPVALAALRLSWHIYRHLYAIDSHFYHLVALS